MLDAAGIPEDDSHHCCYENLQNLYCFGISKGSVLFCGAPNAGGDLVCAVGRLLICGTYDQLPTLFTPKRRGNLPLGNTADCNVIVPPIKLFHFTLHRLAGHCTKNVGCHAVYSMAVQVDGAHPFPLSAEACTKISQKSQYLCADKWQMAKEDLEESPLGFLVLLYPLVINVNILEPAVCLQGTSPMNLFTKPLPRARKQ